GLLWLDENEPLHAAVQAALLLNTYSCSLLRARVFFSPPLTRVTQAHQAGCYGWMRMSRCMQQCRRPFFSRLNCIQT
ncbi:unnamed protein product, partial [Closterium sp. Naga37s-1]